MRFGFVVRTDFNQFFRLDSCRVVKSSAPDISSIVSITRLRMAEATSVSGMLGPLPNKIHPGETLVMSAIASMILRFGFFGSMVSRRCSPVLESSMPYSCSRLLSVAGPICALWRADRILLAILRGLSGTLSFYRLKDNEKHSDGATKFH